MDWCSSSSIDLRPGVGECSAYLVVAGFHALCLFMSTGLFLASLRLLGKQPAPRRSLLWFCVMCIPLVANGGWMALGSWTGVDRSMVRVLAGGMTALCWAWVAMVSALTRDWSSQGLCVMRKTVCVGSAVTLALLLPFDALRVTQQSGPIDGLIVDALSVVVAGVQVWLAWRLADGTRRATLTAKAEKKRRSLAGAVNSSSDVSEPLLDVIDGDLVVDEDEEGAGGGDVEEGRGQRRRGPEGRAGLLSRLTFWWIMPLLRRGYRQRCLQQEDLLPLEGRDGAGRSHATFRGYWEEMVRSSGRPRRRAHGWHIIRVLLHANFDTFFACGAVLLASTAVALSVPVVLNELLSYLEGGDRGRGSLQGYMLAAGLFVLVVLQSLTEHQFWIIGVRCCMRAQTALMGECFRKALRLSPDGRRCYTTGDLINLLSVDACRVADTNIVPVLHWGTWCSVVIMAVSLVALHRLLGLSAFVGIGIVLVFWPLGYLLGKRGKRASMKIQQERDQRAKLMAQALESIRLIKSLQWERFAEQVMQAARAREIRAQIKRQACFGGNGILASVAQVMGPLAAFACRILWEGKSLTAATAFTALAWFNILKRPLQLFPSALTSLLDCLVSWERLELLFDADEVQSTHTLMNLRRGSKQDALLRSPWAIDVKHCSFGWSSDGPAVLRDLELRIYEGEMVVVVGPVGCGKSTLLHALIGDCREQSGMGRCKVNGRVAFVGQTPWVQNATIADNITFGRPYHRAAFQETIRRCSLRFDLQALASRGGEGMECGEGGVALSGGQKQRLAVARAVYSNADVLLFDDVLSSLDVTVGRRIWEDCLVGLHDKTRVIVTHQTQYLQHPAVDRVVVLGEDGCIRAMGSYQELLTSTDKVVVETVLGMHARAPTEQQQGRGRAEGDEESKEESGDEDEAQQMAEIATPVAFVEKEERRQGRIDARLLAMYLRRLGGGSMGLWLGVVVLGLFVVEQAVNVFQWFWLSRLTRTQAGQEEQVKGLLVVGGCLLLVTSVRIVLLMYGAITAGNSLHTSMLLALLRAPMRFFDRQVSGRILNRFIADQASIDSVVPTTLADFFQQLLYFGATLAVLCYALPEMLPVVLLLAIPYQLISNFYRWPARDLRRLESVSKSPVNSHFMETIRGSSVIRAFGAEDRFLHQHLALSTRAAQCFWNKWVANQWVTIWLEMVGSAFMLLCGLLTVWATSHEAPAMVRRGVDGGKMGLLMSYAVLVPWSLGWLLKVYFQAEVEFIAVERVSHYIAIPPEEEESAAERQGGEAQTTVDIRVSSPPGRSASVMARDVSMRYDVDGEITLRGCSFSVPTGAKVAVVGRTAAGKSSVFQLLLGFYPSEDGLLTVAGVPIGSMPLDRLRQQVRLVPQTPTLFGLTVRDALTGRLSPRAEQEQEAAVWRVLSRVQMVEAIRCLPQGLATPLASVEFSAGERQLLCIARALLHPAPVLLCDEVTSSIDLATDRLVQRILLSLDATVIMICHRLHHILDFDRVLVMEHGAVVEEGAPRDLLKDQTGVLSAMMRNALGAAAARSH